MTASESLLPARAVQKSDALHARVRRFAELWENPPLLPEPDADTFDSLTLAIAEYQAEHCPGYGRLIELTGAKLDSVASLPAVPTDVFRLTRVAAHPPELDRAVFETSGTTAAESGRHHQRDLTTYEALALALARRSLFHPLPARSVIVALAQRPESPPRSSLLHMMQLFMERFDGRALVSEPEGVPFRSDGGDRWLIGSSGPDVSSLVRACKIARQRSEPLVILTTSFALVALLDALDGEVLPGPERTIFMLTGGFKGRSREVSPERLRSSAARAVRGRVEWILGEYGMTELTSQLYEAWPDGAFPPNERAPTSRLAPELWPTGGRPGIYFAPPWLRVSAVDPVSSEEVAPGEIGLARFVDLANVDSAVAVQTQDRIRVVDGGIELLGRAPLAIPRGCSLPFEGLLAGPAHSLAGGRRS